MPYSLASLTELGLAPMGIPCLCSASIRTSRMSLLYESKSKTFRTTFAKPSSGNFCWEAKWNRRWGRKGRGKGERRWSKRVRKDGSSRKTRKRDQGQSKRKGEKRKWKVWRELERRMTEGIVRGMKERRRKGNRAERVKKKEKKDEEYF